MGGQEGKSEEVLHSLTEFCEMPPSQRLLSPELESVLEDIAKTGKVLYPWKLMRPVVFFKLEKVVQEFFESSQFPDDEHPEAEFLSLKSSVLSHFKRFSMNPPFTIQRICELLVSPRNGYTNCVKYMRGLLKNVKVVSTIGLPVCNGVVPDGLAWETTDCNGRSSESPGVTTSSIVTTASMADSDEAFSVNTVRPSTPPATFPSPYSPPLSPTSEDTRIIDDRPKSGAASDNRSSTEILMQNGSNGSEAVEHSQGVTSIRSSSNSSSNGNGNAESEVQQGSDSVSENSFLDTG